MEHYIKKINKIRKEQHEKEFAKAFNFPLSQVDAGFLYDLEGDKKKLFESLKARFKPVNENDFHSVNFMTNDGQRYDFPFEPEKPKAKVVAVKKGQGRQRPIARGSA